MKFESLGELLEDEHFRSNAKKIISDLVKPFTNRPKPKDGMKYKRTWYDRITDSHSFDFDFFMSNIEKVILKESSLNSEARSVLLHIYNNATIKTLVYYKKLENHETKS